MRNLDGIVRCPLPPAEGFKQPPRFPSASAAQFRHRNRSTNAIDDFVRMTPQQSFVSPCKTVLRKMTDDLEQRRSHVIVEILRRQFLLAGTRQSGMDFGGKFVACAARNRVN